MKKFPLGVLPGGVDAEDILNHADRRALEPPSATRVPCAVARRLIRALRLYGDDSTSIGDALRRAAADLGVEAGGRGFEELAELVMAAMEASGGISDLGSRRWRHCQEQRTHPL